MKKKKHNLKIATEQLAKLQTEQQQNEFSAFIERERNTVLINTYTTEVARTGYKEAERRAKRNADEHIEALIIQEAHYLQVKKQVKEQVEEIYRADVASALVRKFDSIKKENDIVAAAKFIEEFNKKHSDFKHYDCDDKDIIELAKACAEQCAEFERRFRNDIQFAVILMHQHADTMHVEHATAVANDPVIITEKYTDELWWRPRLRRIIRRRREELAFDCDLINPNTAKYSSKLTQKERKQQLERNENWAAKTVLVCDDVRLNMSDLITSKEKCYQSELVTMIRGLRDIQDANNWDAKMITITCPSRMHKFSQIKKENGTKYFKKNKKFDGTTPAESANHLRKVWARARAQAKRENLFVAGMQVWQPHGDACAHQHIYCIGEKSQLEQFAEICNHYALEEDRHEAGAQKRRCNIRNEDRSKGRLSSYASRYVSRLAQKRLNSKDTCATDIATPEDSWYSAHGIRRVSFFGLPPKKIWRYFREASRSICNTEQLQEIRKAARAGKYADFVKALGWTGIKKDLDFETFYEEAENRYRETVKKEIGIRFGAVNILKAVRNWVIETMCTVTPNCPSAAAGGVKTAFADVIEQSEHVEPVPIPV